MKRYINANTSTSNFDNLREGITNEVKGFVVGGILAPISLFLGALTLGTLILIAFGKVNYWGGTGKLLVGIGVPLIIGLCFKRSIGNLIFTIWSFILVLVLFITPILTILYFMGLKPIFEYLIG